MQCEEWADANSELFKEAHDKTVHKNSYKRKLYELISASLKRGHYGRTALCHMTIPGSIERPLLSLNRVASEHESHQRTYFALCELDL